MGRLRDALGHFIRGSSSSSTPPPAPESQADGDAGQSPSGGDAGSPSESTPQLVAPRRRRRKPEALEVSRGNVDASGEVRRSRGAAPDSDS